MANFWNLPEVAAIEVPGLSVFCYLLAGAYPSIVPYPVGRPAVALHRLQVLRDRSEVRNDRVAKGLCDGRQLW